MKTLSKNFILIMILVCVEMQFSLAQSNRDWWNSLPPIWKKIIQKQELKGKDVDPTDEQLDRIVKIKFIDCSNNSEIESLAPLGKLELLEVLRCGKSGIKNLEGIESLKYLRELDCGDNDNINSVIPLIGLTGLEKLYCGNTMIKDLKPLKDLKKLQVLDIHFATVSELTFIGTLVNLERLDVSQNQSLFTIAGIEKLRKLTELRMNETKVLDLSPLSGLTSLETLDISSTPIQSLKYLQNLKDLKDIDCSDTQIKGASFDYIMGLKFIVRFRCINNDITKLDKEQLDSFLKKTNPDANVNITLKK